MIVLASAPYDSRLFWRNIQFAELKAQEPCGR
jgi:hypothetical protein